MTALQGKAALQEQALQGRRASIGVGLVAAASAVALPVAASAEPRITARCAFDIRIGNDKMTRLRRLVIGLFGEEAPVLTRTFTQACTATYPGEAGVLAAYKLADVKNIIKDKAITWANFKDGNKLTLTVATADARWVGSKTVSKPLAGDDTKTDEVNSLRHDLPGRVSMRRGGGTFDFTVAPVADATWLDETDVVIGQVLEGMDIIADINEIRMYGTKPLKKVRIFKSQLLPTEASGQA